MISINGNSINTTRFPDNTSQVWKLPIDTYQNHVTVVWHYSHEAEILELAQLKLLLNCNFITADLDIKYLPYARQDKDVKNDATFGLRTFAHILNNMSWGRVSIHDPHSEKALELIHHSNAYYPTVELDMVWHHTEADIVCYPDAGALNKYSHMHPYPQTWSVKKRDQLTGKIIESYLAHPEQVKDKSVLIVDDICDGGMTFILLADLLRQAGAREINLFVSHGIFSRGLRLLQEAGIAGIYTPEGRAYKHQEYVSYHPLENLR